MILISSFPYYKTGCFQIIPANFVLILTQVYGESISSVTGVSLKRWYIALGRIKFD